MAEKMCNLNKIGGGMSVQTYTYTATTDSGGRISFTQDINAPCLSIVSLQANAIVDGFRLDAADATKVLVFVRNSDNSNTFANQSITVRVSYIET